MAKRGIKINLRKKGKKEEREKWWDGGEDVDNKLDETDRRLRTIGRQDTVLDGQSSYRVYHSTMHSK